MNGNGGRKPSARQLEAAIRWIAQREATLKRRLNYGERIEHLERAFDWTRGTIERLALESLDADRLGADGRKARQA